MPEARPSADKAALMCMPREKVEFVPLGEAAALVADFRCDPIVCSECASTRGSCSKRSAPLKSDQIPPPMSAVDLAATAIRILGTTIRVISIASVSRFIVHVVGDRPLLLRAEHAPKQQRLAPPPQRR